MKCDELLTITGCVPTNDNSRNVNDSCATESDIDNDQTNSFMSKDNVDVNLKCIQHNSSENTASSFSLTLEKNKLYKGIYGLILTDIPDVQIVSPSDVTGHLIKENKMLYQWPKQIPDTKGPVHFTVKKMELPYDERHFRWQLSFTLKKSRKKYFIYKRITCPRELNSVSINESIGQVRLWSWWTVLRVGG